MKKSPLRIGVDIGGTHVSAALVDTSDGRCVDGSYVRGEVDPQASATRILEAWTRVIDSILSKAGSRPVESIGIAIPGPFDYTTGTAMIRGLAKYESLYGLNIREALQDRIADKDIPIFFGNDAACFGLGEARTGKAAGHSKIIAITLGTGLGACYIDKGRLALEGKGVPPQGYLYNFPFLDATGEDYISARWLIRRYREMTGKEEKDVRAIAELATAPAHSLFQEFGANLGHFIGPRLRDFDADCLVIGGSISHSKELFLDKLMSALNAEGISCTVYFSEGTELIAMAGAATLMDQQSCGDREPSTATASCPPVSVAPKAPPRKTSQAQLPQTVATGAATATGYRIFPYESLGTGHIHKGYDSLASWMIRARTVRIDGYTGLDWDHLRLRLSAEFRKAGIKSLWYETKAFQKPEREIEGLIAPFLGTPGSVWGTKTTLSLVDFYTPELVSWQPNEDADLIILAGTGAGLSAWQTPVAYIDLPKNELQYRMRAGSATNLGSTVTLSNGVNADNAMQPGSTAKPNSIPDADSAPTPDNPVGLPFAEMYKRCYFVDWVVLNRHRQVIKDSIVLIADGQWDIDINWAMSASLEKGLQTIAENVIRNRPWFEPGVWGGQWLKEKIPALSRDEVNYAWSFELIAPENGLVFESDGYLLEISFDWLMETAGNKVLGVDSQRFGLEFPIRFDFLDTVGGGNLSIQCHPSLDYISTNFGETITQDETYYILDRKGDASVYLGFQENIEPDTFRQALERSQREKTAIDIEKFVQRLPAERHDLFLIPNRTVHGAGIGNLVLEISATPYIFTFKMYDWMRLDLDGLPRPINIEHAFNNLDFDRKGKKVQKELISQPVVITEEEGLLLEELPTHPEHFYAIHRLSLTAEKKALIPTNGKCHLLMLVEGASVLIRTAAGREWQARYAETFVLPAAAGSYELINTNHQPLKLVKAFVK